VLIQVEAAVFVYVQEIDEVERKHYVALRELLDKSAHLWPQHSCNYKDMCQTILHEDAKVLARSYYSPRLSKKGQNGTL